MTSSSEPPSTPPNPRTGVSSRQGVTGAAGIMMAAILASRLLGLVRESVIAHQFGQDRLTDVYNAAFTIPDLLFFLIAGGAFSGAFIPVFSEYLALGKKRQAWRIFSVIASTMFLVVSAFIIFGEIFTAPLVVLTSGFINVPGGVMTQEHLSGFSLISFLLKAGWGYFLHPSTTPDKILRTVQLTRIVLPGQLCFFLGGLMMGALQARGNPWGQAIGPIVYNLFIILGGVALAPFIGVAGLCWGALIGAIIGNFLLQWYLVVRNGGSYKVQALWENWSHPGVHKVWKLMLPVILGLALPQISTIVGRMFAGSLGDGPVSAFSNANKLMQVPLGVFAQATAIALLPVMSAQAARKELSALRESINFGIRSILFMTIPSSILMWVLALPIVQIVYQSGHFSYNDALLAADILRWFSVGIFAWSAHSIITRGFFALQESRVPIIVGTFVTLIFIPMNLPLKNLMHASGLALATSIAATIHMVVLLALLHIRLKGLEDARLAISIAKTCVASLIAAIACSLLYRPLFHHFLENADHGARAKAGFVLLICLVVSGLIYIAAAIAMRMEEVKILHRLVQRLRPKSA